MKQDYIGKIDPEDVDLRLRLLEKDSSNAEERISKHKREASEDNSLLIQGLANLSTSFTQFKDEMNDTLYKSGVIPFIKGQMSIKGKLTYGLINGAVIAIVVATINYIIQRFFAV